MGFDELRVGCKSCHEARQGFWMPPASTSGGVVIPGTDENVNDKHTHRPPALRKAQAPPRSVA